MRVVRGAEKLDLHRPERGRNRTLTPHPAQGAVSLAENPRARIGGNFPPPDDEKLPPKAERIVSRERARQVEIAARLLKALYAIPLKRIMTKRDGGDDGRAMRQFLLAYARGIGSPVWECALIFDLNRKQIGQEEAAFIRFMADHPALEEDADNMISMLDYGLKVRTGRYLKCALSAMQAEHAAKQAVKDVRAAADALERAAPAPARKPAPSEIDRLLAANQRARRLAGIEQQIAIHMAVIRAAAIKGAGKDALADAKRAVKALDALVAERKQIKASAR